MQSLYVGADGALAATLTIRAASLSVLFHVMSDNRCCPACKVSIPRGEKSLRRCKSCARVYHHSCLKGEWSWDHALYRCALCCMRTSPFPSKPVFASVRDPVHHSVSEPSIDLVSTATKTPLTSLARKHVPTRRLASQLSPPSPADQQPAKLSCLEYTAPSTSLDTRFSANAGAADSDMDVMPDWFDEWTRQKIDPIASNVEKVSGKLDGLSSKVKSLEAIQSGLVNTHLLTDTCEVKISGIPKSPQNEHATVLEKIFNTIGTVSCTNHITSVRNWSPSSQAQNQGSPNDDSASIVIQTVSATVRNSILSKSRLLKGKTAHSIFGCGAKRPIFISAIWPRPVYELLRLATEKSKALNYARPVVRNLVVCMKPTSTAQPIPVFSNDELNNSEKFPPNPRTE